MTPTLALLATLYPLASTINSLSQLNRAIHAAQLPAHQAVGFLTRGNYQSVASILPKENTTEGGPGLRVKLYTDLEHLEQAVVSGDIIAGLSSSPPANDDGHLSVFPAGLITLKSMLVAPGSDTLQLRQALDAAIVRTIHNGTYESLESKYFISDGFKSVAAFSCGIEPTNFDFPPAGSATGALADVLSNGELRMGGFESDWGYQGNYRVDPMTGYWVEYMNAIFAHFKAAYPSVSLVHVWNTTSNNVMQDVLEGRADATLPYFHLNGWYGGNSQARTEVFEPSCTVEGAEDVFFTLGAAAAARDTLSAGEIAAIAVCAGVAALAAVLLLLMVHRERQGTPMFKPLVPPADTKMPA